MSKFFEKTVNKLKNIKHIEIIIAIIFGVILLMIYLSTFSNTSSSKQNTTATTASAYSTELETRLEGLLSQIKGAGKVKVMIVLKSGTELSSNTLPDISSCIVVAEGAEDYGVKLNILRAVESAINLPTTNIEVLVGNK